MKSVLADAIARRDAWLAPLSQTSKPKSAFRLLDGYREGDPRFVVDVYGTSVVVFDHRDVEAEDDGAALELARAVMDKLGFLQTAVHKRKASRDPELRRGSVIVGDEKDLCRAIEEDGVRYAVRLLAHHDASFYLDTRSLRSFVRERFAGKRVLNAFAYTGSIGVAARAAPAKLVVHTDKNKEFLTIAKDSYALNGFAVERAAFIAGDFFEISARMRKKEELFDCVVLDPPLFAESAKGRVDVEASFTALLDKARPLVGDGGLLIVVNNALFVPGAAFMSTLEEVVAGGYATLEATIPVPEDCAPIVEGGGSPPADPAPFNHPTKIAALKMVRRDKKKAS